MLMRQTVTFATGFGAATSRRCRRVLGERDRPAGHNFATADQALVWGRQIREKIAEVRVIESGARSTPTSIQPTVWSVVPDQLGPQKSCARNIFGSCATRPRTAPHR